ncbi:MAG: PAS domain-containing protein [Usitatibacter sp.]
MFTSKKPTGPCHSSAADCVKILDLDGNMVHMNVACRDMLGTSDFTSFLGTSWAQLWKDGALEAATASIAEAVGGKVSRFEASRRLNDATQLWDVVVTPITGSDGKVERLLSVSRDITQHRLAATQANESRLAMEALLLAGEVGTWAYEIDSDRVTADNNLAALFAITPGVASGRPLADYLRAIHPDDLPRVKDEIAKSIATPGIAFESQYRISKRDGTLRHVLSRGKVERDAAGKPTRLPGVILDITDRVTADEALKRSEENFRQLADAMPQIVWAATPDGALDYYNRRWFEYIAVSPGDMVEARWDQYLHPDDMQVTYEKWVESVRDGTPYEKEFRVRRADGAYRWFLALALPIRETDGTISRWYGTCTDIDERQQLKARLEEALESERAARNSVEHASRMKDEFLATLSHELRTPLSAILGWTHILRGKAGASEDMRRGLETIDRNARVQTQLIEDLLDMSRIVSGKVRLDVQPMHPLSFIEAAIETVAPAAEAKGIRIEKVLDPGAGPVSGDASRMQQVVWNLLSNAIKFTPRGGRVQVLLERVNSHLEISVADTGQGIGAEFVPHVFDRFRQADSSTTRVHGGLGLGLAIVKQLVELHGGTVSVKSGGEAKGTTFSILLPLKITHLGSSEPERVHPKVSRAPQPGAPNADLGGLTILVVDDQPDARELLKRILEDCAATVVTGANADEGLAAIALHKPHLLISDIGMARVDGYEFIRRVRALGAANGGNLPAIALTAFARTEDKTRALMSGFIAHISKPADPSEVIATVASVAGRTDVRLVMQ